MKNKLKKKSSASKFNKVLVSSTLIALSIYLGAII